MFSLNVKINKYFFKKHCIKFINTIWLFKKKLSNQCIKIQDCIKLSFTQREKKYIVYYFHRGKIYASTIYYQINLFQNDLYFIWLTIQWDFNTFGWEIFAIIYSSKIFN